MIAVSYRDDIYWPTGFPFKGKWNENNMYIVILFSGPFKENCPSYYYKLSLLPLLFECCVRLLKDTLLHVINSLSAIYDKD